MKLEHPGSPSRNRHPWMPVQSALLLVHEFDVRGSFAPTPTVCVKHF